MKKLYLLALITAGALLSGCSFHVYVHTVQDQAANAQTLPYGPHYPIYYFPAFEPGSGISFLPSPDSNTITIVGTEADGGPVTNTVTESWDDWIIGPTTVEPGQIIDDMHAGPVFTTAKRDTAMVNIFYQEGGGVLITNNNVPVIFTIYGKDKKGTVVDSFSILQVEASLVVPNE